MLVRKQHPYDGTAMAGKPKGPVLEVLVRMDHKPTDGEIAEKAIALLSDGTWEFIHNLTIIKDFYEP